MSTLPFMTAALSDVAVTFSAVLEDEIKQLEASIPKQQEEIARIEALRAVDTHDMHTRALDRIQVAYEETCDELARRTWFCFGPMSLRSRLRAWRMRAARLRYANSSRAEHSGRAELVRSTTKHRH